MQSGCQATCMTHGRVYSMNITRLIAILERTQYRQHAKPVFKILLRKKIQSLLRYFWCAQDSMRVLLELTSEEVESAPACSRLNPRVPMHPLVCLCSQILLTSQMPIVLDWAAA